METTLESFYELFSHNVFPLAPYDRADAQVMVERLMARREVLLTQAVIEDLMKASGGHSGLLRAGFELASRTPPHQARSALERMADDYGAEVECRKIWNSLTEREREVLSRVAASRPWSGSDDAIPQHLEVKGLLVSHEGDKKVLFSPVFAEWVRRKQAT